MDEITKNLRKHYAQKFDEYGATPKGVDWNREGDVFVRYEQMLSLIKPADLLSHHNISFLDVGCGYGGLLTYARKKGVHLFYTGIDVAENMIEYANKQNMDAKFFCTDVFELDTEQRFDYVICNGILTQKLTTSIIDMDEFAKKLIAQMFYLCNKGIAFNIMTTKVNFMVDNLYYKNPIEMLAYCFTNISHKVRLDHSYPLYEYTIYIYK